MSQLLMLLKQCIYQRNQIFPENESLHNSSEINHNEIQLCYPETKDPQLINKTYYNIKDFETLSTQQTIYYVYELSNTKIPDSTQITDDIIQFKVSLQANLAVLLKNVDLSYVYTTNQIGLNDVTLLVFNKKIHEVNLKNVTNNLTNLVGMVIYSNMDNNALNEFMTLNLKSKWNEINRQSLIKGINNITFDVSQNIYIDVIFSKQPGLGSALLRIFKEKNVFLYSIDSAYYFYIKKGFRNIYNQETQQVTLPYDLIKDSGNIYYKYKLSDKYIIITDTNGTDVNAQQLEDAQPLEDAKQIDFYEDDELIKLIKLKDSNFGGSTRINYKKRSYKLRKDRYGQYIITKDEGRVSYKKILAWQEKSKKSKHRSL